MVACGQHAAHIRLTYNPQSSTQPLHPPGSCCCRDRVSRLPLLPLATGSCPCSWGLGNRNTLHTCQERGQVAHNVHAAKRPRPCTVGRGGKKKIAGGEFWTAQMVGGPWVCSLYSMHPPAVQKLAHVGHLGGTGGLGIRI